MSNAPSLRSARKPHPRGASTHPRAGGSVRQRGRPVASGEALTSRFDSTFLAAASRFSRREFVTRAGGIGLALGVGMATLGNGFFLQQAGADGSCKGGACGPDPIAPTGLCNTTQPANGAKNRNYNTLNCGTSGNTWIEGPYGFGCRDQGTWGCGDICIPQNLGAPVCGGCLGTYYAAICAWYFG